MKKSELTQHKKALHAKKQDLERSIGKKGLTGRSGTDAHGDFADRSTAANEEEISIQLKQTDAKLLRAIEDALGRVEAGAYGVCVDCDDEISATRLEAVPWTKVCIACKEKQYS
ncbi:MAG: TraR/DksA family transcriptional regulator [Acidobacteria bacterium]|nr:MAG: TraR/DksA family transcriptional regulator [Acidobacteriota bacterium]